MAAGTVVRFSGNSGYGFITPDDGGEDVFVHASLFPDPYRDFVPTGTRVEFEAVKGDRGLKAVSVTVLSAGPPPTAAPAPTRTVSATGVEQDESLCDVVPATEFAQRVTETLIEVAPTITGAQIAEIRQRLLAYGRRRGWIED